MLSRDLVKTSDPIVVEKFMAVLEEIPDLAMDVLRFQKAFGRRLFLTVMVEPRSRDGVVGTGKCYFHTHAGGEACHL